MVITRSLKLQKVNRQQPVEQKIKKSINTQVQENPTKPTPIPDIKILDKKEEKKPLTQDQILKDLIPSNNGSVGNIGLPASPPLQMSPMLSTPVVETEVKNSMTLQKSKTGARTPKIPPLARPTVGLPTNIQPFNREHFIEHMVNKYNLRIGCELGVWKGRTFLYLLKNCPNLKMFGIDLWAPQPSNDGPENYIDWPHAENERFVRGASEKYGKRSTIYKMWTHDAAMLFKNESLDFVFIDADHSTEAVRKDLKAYLPKVKPDGWIIGHDINWPTVQTVAREMLPGYHVGPDNVWFRNKNPEIKY